jgi:hypothetical protein
MLPIPPVLELPARRSVSLSGAVGFLLASAVASASETSLTVWLSEGSPGRSHAVLELPDGFRHRFPVGSGRHGIRPEGATFREGWSLLGRFRVNLILSREGRCEMTAELAAAAGKSREELRRTLFAGMDGIDFDGDGRAGEYGDGYIGLEPENPGVAQPFGFGFHRGVFRRYSYALHGTEDEARIGRRSTGGCINFRRDDLRRLLRSVRLGDLVEVRLLPEDGEKSPSAAILP